MVEKSLTPSELHLKKELTVLRKTRLLRDPETCASWRSPLSSKSFGAYNLCLENGIRDISTRENTSVGLLEIPPISEKKSKQVYLYNWKGHSNKPSESGIKLDEEGKQASVASSLEDNVINFHKEGTVDDRYLVPATNLCNVRGAVLETPQRSSATRLRKPAIPKKRVMKHAAILKQMELPSSPLGVLSSVELSDDTEYCNSEEQILELDLLCNAVHHSPSTSPLFPVSGCANWRRSSKVFRSARREGSSHSCTPASTSSYYRHVGQKPSTVGSWGGTTTSCDADDFDQLELPARQGCGVPCYWSKRTKDWGSRRCYSPSLSNTIRKKGGSFFRGSQAMYNKKRSMVLGTTKCLSKSSQGLPLLTNNSDKSSSDEISANLGELDLEALSRLDGRRWSSCKSQEAFEAVGPGEVGLGIEDNKSLSFRYRPRTFDEIIGQNIVVQSLMNAVLRGRIASGYLFQGPRGTGKSSTARIFAAALNCLATGENKPCCLCMECTTFIGVSGSSVREVSATNKKAIDCIRYTLKNMTMRSGLSPYKTFIIDDCHLLTSKLWSLFIRFLEDPIAHVVFIFITIDHENTPCAIISRCQKYMFSKIKDADVIYRLRKLSAAENLDVEMDALNLIAISCDGSLEDAETMLYQLSLLGKRITASLVNDLMGVVSDEKLFDLLEVAMSSNPAEIVKRSRELMDSGVDPMALMSQLAGLIMDIIAGTHQLAHSSYHKVALGGQNLAEDELKRLQQALKILSDAQKQLKHSSEHSMLTTALLQLASGQNLESIQLNTGGKHGFENMNDSMKISASVCRRSHSSAIDPSTRCKKSTPTGYQPSSRMLTSHDPISSIEPAKLQSVKRNSSNKDHLDYNAIRSSRNLSEIWRSCIETCYSKALKQMLSLHGKLISISENEGMLIAFIAFTDNSVKLRAERYLSSITNSLEMVLKQNVKVRMGLSSYSKNSLEPVLDPLTFRDMEKIGSLDNQRKIVSNGMKSFPDKDDMTLSFPRKSSDASGGSDYKKVEKSRSSLPRDDGLQLESYSVPLEGNNRFSGTKDKGMEIAFLKKHSMASNELRLENAWLQAAEKGLSGYPILSNTDKDQAIQQNVGSNQLYYDSSVANDRPSCTEEPNHSIKAPSDQGHHMAQVGEDTNHYAISPCLLHSNSFGTNFDKDILEYDSGPGCCNGLFCWKANRSHRRHAKQGAHPRSQKTSHILFFGQRVKSTTRESTLRR